MVITNIDQPCAISSEELSKRNAIAGQFRVII